MTHFYYNFYILAFFPNKTGNCLRLMEKYAKDIHPCMKMVYTLTIHLPWCMFSISKYDFLCLKLYMWTPHTTVPLFFCYFLNSKVGYTHILSCSAIWSVQNPTLKSFCGHILIPVFSSPRTSYFYSINFPIPLSWSGKTMYKISYGSWLYKQKDHNYKQNKGGCG